MDSLASVQINDQDASSRSVGLPARSRTARPQMRELAVQISSLSTQVRTAALGKRDQRACCSAAQSRPTPSNPMDCSTPGFPVLHYLPEFAQIHVHWVSDVLPSHLILCRPLLLPSTFPSSRVFSNESALCIRWPKYWSFSFSISPCDEYSGLISFRTDWFDLGETHWSHLHSRDISALACPAALCFRQLQEPEGEVPPLSAAKSHPPTVFPDFLCLG